MRRALRGGAFAGRHRAVDIQRVLFHVSLPRRAEVAKATLIGFSKGVQFAVECLVNGLIAHGTKVFFAMVALEIV